MHLSRVRLRITVRSLMIVVAIVGLVLGGNLWVFEMRARSTAYRRRAREFGLMSCRAEKVGRTKDGRMVNLYETENHRITDEWTYMLAEKYWRLADRPWLPLDPDPPPPKPLAHPRAAVDLPADFPSWHWQRDPVYPWWTFLWTWHSE